MKMVVKNGKTITFHDHFLKVSAYEKGENEKLNTYFYEIFQ